MAPLAQRRVRGRHLERVDAHVGSDGMDLELFIVCSTKFLIFCNQGRHLPKFSVCVELWEIYDLAQFLGSCLRGLRGVLAQQTPCFHPIVLDGGSHDFGRLLIPHAFL